MLPLRFRRVSIPSVLLPLLSITFLIRGGLSPASAHHADVEWIEGIVLRVDPRTRTLELAEYAGGEVRPVCRLSAPSFLLTGVKPGDRVWVQLLDESRVLDLEVLPPPKGDDQYWDTFHRLSPLRP